MEYLDPARHRYRDSRFRGTELTRQFLLETTTTVYVGNLAFHTPEVVLWRLFSWAGPVRRLIMGLHSVQFTPAGFCFVEYETHEAAVLAVRYLNHSMIENRTIHVGLDTGYVEGRELARGTTGYQVRDEVLPAHDRDRPTRVGPVPLKRRPA